MHKPLYDKVRVTHCFLIYSIFIISVYFFYLGKRIYISAVPLVFKFQIFNDICINYNLIDVYIKTIKYIIVFCLVKL